MKKEFEDKSKDIEHFEQSVILKNSNKLKGSFKDEHAVNPSVLGGEQSGEINAGGRLGEVTQQDVCAEAPCDSENEGHHMNTHPVPSTHTQQPDIGSRGTTRTETNKDLT